MTAAVAGLLLAGYEMSPLSDPQVPTAEMRVAAERVNDLLAQKLYPLQGLGTVGRVGDAQEPGPVLAVPEGLGVGLVEAAGVDGGQGLQVGGPLVRVRGAQPEPAQVGHCFGGGRSEAGQASGRRFGAAPGAGAPLVGEFGDEYRDDLGAEVVGEDVLADPGQPWSLVADPVALTR
ncbi:hypothetical protein [Kitasatospora sp. NBC_00315]|uniref:hypothetical protein n=1 Tax=Kitasatospora sp. NBC_00315 TaxID=2975963 RepID=UPI003243EA58